MNTIGIIGGSGFSEPQKFFKQYKEIVIKTPYGEKKVFMGEAFGTQIVFISRHGEEKKVPPHLINHRANIWALKEKGCNVIISTSAVGSISKHYPIGEIALPDQYIDLSWRPVTFFDGASQEPYHADMTNPFSHEVRKMLRNYGEEAGVSVHIDGIYVCNPGPQFETAAEIAFLQRAGAHLVGMTVAPEAKLARELKIHYQPVCLPVNWGAGLTREPLSHENTLTMVKKMSEDVMILFDAALQKIAKSELSKIQ